MQVIAKERVTGDGNKRFHIQGMHYYKNGIIKWFLNILKKLLC